MKKKLILSIAFVATLVVGVSLKSYANDDIQPRSTKYCAYNEIKGICEWTFNGVPCVTDENGDCKDLIVLPPKPVPDPEED